MELELKRIDDTTRCWILHTKEKLICSWCGKPTREGYFCKEQDKIWHSECFKQKKWDCNNPYIKDFHQDFCVTVKEELDGALQKSFQDEKKD